MPSVTHAVLFLAATVSLSAVEISEPRLTWQPITISWTGPESKVTATDPNPFLDLRLQVVFTGPNAERFAVPGFFDSDGHGGARGNIWRVRFTPNCPGIWRYEASLRAGKEIAVDLSVEAGEALVLPDPQGSFLVGPCDPEAPGFLKWGRLQYVGKHYLKFADGPYWIRGGTDEPEDLLGYVGFERTIGKHRYAAHEENWKPGDPDWGDGQGRGLIGALNYLASKHVNSIYFMPMNVGGDGKNVWPWIGSLNPRGSRDNEHRHFDTAKLAQWEIVFAHAQRLGIFLHFVLNEAEAANKRELDDGELGVERKLYYRELVARFGHHLALQWNLCEEYNLQFDWGPDRSRAFADYLVALDPYHHPVTIHSAGNPVEALRFTYGDPRFSMTSIQLNQRPIHEITRAIWHETERAGRPLPVSLDEFTLDRGQKASHIPVDDAEGHRREKIWPTYLSGGMLEFILEDLLITDNFKTPERGKLWDYLWYSRRFLETELPFWDMQPVDDLVREAGTIPLRIGKGQTQPLGPQVFAKLGEVYAIYLPTASPAGKLNLTDFPHAFVQRWYNPRIGEFAGSTKDILGGSWLDLGHPPADPHSDWVVLIKKTGP